VLLDLLFQFSKHAGPRTRCGGVGCFVILLPHAASSPQVAHGSMDQQMADQAELARLLYNVESDSFHNGYLETRGHDVAAPQGTQE
jgi:hypothetical protein